jgi:hypothetical protein
VVRIPFKADSVGLYDRERTGGDFAAPKKRRSILQPRHERTLSRSRTTLREYDNDLDSALVRACEPLTKIAEEENLI